MVIRQWVLVMSLGLASLPASAVTAQDAGMTTTSPGAGVSFATPDGVFWFSLWVASANP
ncbi:MAG: hypothetical protein HC929_22080 [Leptolyngbyaceae cyanobacterium SM2_5_2]|nr:hypothetical protein [Leptolyngbyaceae cyanobacterium SM2_5_2]